MLPDRFSRRAGAVLVATVSSANAQVHPKDQGVTSLAALADPAVAPVELERWIARGADALPALRAFLVSGAAVDDAHLGRVLWIVGGIGWPASGLWPVVLETLDDAVDSGAEPLQRQAAWTLRRLVTAANASTACTTTVLAAAA